MKDEGKLPPTLDELMDGAEATLDKEETKVKAGKEKEEELEEEEEEETEEEEKADKEEAEKKALDKKNKEAKNKTPKAKKEDKEEETEEEKKEDSKDKEEDEEGEEGDGKEFWSDVEKLTGEKVEVDFGDVRPDTPAGAVLYAKAYREKGVEDFEANLEKNFPREYKALQLASEGIDPSTLYKDMSTTDYSKVTLDEKNVADNKKYYIESLKLRGNSDDDINDLVKLAEEKGKLVEKGKTGLKELQDHQTELNKSKDEETGREVAKRTQLIDSMVEVVSGIVNKGQIGNFTIPEKDRAALTKKVLKDVRLEKDGKFYSIKELTQKDLDLRLQAEYFEMKKGDLTGLIERKAKTEKVKTLKRRVEESESKSKGGSGGKKSTLSLQDLTEE